MGIDLIIWILAGVVLLNIFYYIYFAKLALFRPSSAQVAKAESPTNNSDPVSVIVCAKNEAENLKNLVPKLLTQDHPDFEVVLVNDYSRDDTLEVIEEFQEKDKRIKLVNVIPNESFWGNKKYALTLGIKKAVHDKLLFTDADCIPASNSWISEMASHYGFEKSIVLGYGGYIRKKGSLLNALIRFETAVAAMQYLSFGMHGNAYMGVGRNLGYTATQFYETSGFMSHMNILGGDDDLFVNEAATRSNTAVSLNPNSFTYSIPKESISSWWKQKRRHINTSSHYKWKHKIALGLFFTSQMLFFIMAVVAALISQSWMIVLGVVVFRYLITWSVVGKSLNILKESKLIILYPFLELLLLLSLGSLFTSNLTHKPRHWD
ncbi:MAG: glycosyltransferase [Nonlabens sp.]